jgi:hypothetical protein
MAIREKAKLRDLGMIQVILKLECLFYQNIHMFYQNIISPYIIFVERFRLKKKVA